MADIQLEIVGLTTGFAQKGSYTLILASPDSDLKLPVVIGNFEAQSIALVMEDIKPHRPLTHDLFINYLEQIGAEIQKVVITSLQEGVFYSSIYSVINGKEVITDSRTSDAIALAIRVDKPIYTTSEILTKAGINMDLDSEAEETPQSETEEQPEVGFGHMSVDELHAALKEAEETEDYERAALLRDEISQRNQD
jgi:hypothetical protein